MPRRSKDEAEKTRKRILVSALSLFAKKGYDKTTFTDIAARLNMTKGAVYWHFASKDDLLKALCDEMLGRFSKLIVPDENRSFAEVCELMIENARQLLKKPLSVAFFLLMHEQVRWSTSAMDWMRERVRQADKWGPWEAFHAGVVNDIRAGRARADVDAKEIATGCMILWNGLVHGQITKLLPCDMEPTMRHAFEGIRRTIAAENVPIIAKGA